MQPTEPPKNAFLGAIEACGWRSPEQPIDVSSILKAAGVEKFVLIVTPGRAGSTMLAAALKDVGGLGAPFEFLAEDVLPGRAQVTGSDSLEEFLARVVTDTASGGVFSLKTTAPRFREFSAVLDFGDFLSPEQSKWIDIRRHDIVAQACSMVRAIKTGVWHVVDGKERGRIVDGERERAIDINDFEVRVSRMIVTLLNSERSTDALFDEIQAAPLRLWYEEMLADFPMAVARAVHHIDRRTLPIDELPAPATSKVTMGQTDEVKMRYLQARFNTLEEIFFDRSTIDTRNLFRRLETSFPEGQ